MGITEALADCDHATRQHSYMQYATRKRAVHGIFKISQPTARSLNNGREPTCGRVNLTFC